MSSRNQPEDRPIEITHSDYGRIPEHGALPARGAEPRERSRVIDHTKPGRGAAADAGQHGDESLFRRRLMVCLALSLPVLLYSDLPQMVLHLGMPPFPGSVWIAPLFSIAVLAYGGLPFLQRAIPELQERRPGGMMLIALAILAASVYIIASLLTGVGSGSFWEWVSLIDMLLLGRWLEMRSVRQASGSLEELAGLLPDTAERILPDGALETIRVRQLRPGYLILVRPGDAIAADGEVVEGESEVNEAQVTGTLSMKKGPGSSVIAGTLNVEKSLRVKATAAGDQTLLANITRLALEAQQNKSPRQAQADRAGAWLVYATLAVAAVTALAWGLAQGWNLGILLRVAAVFVIVNPDALTLTIPLVIAVAVPFGARNGILIRNRRALEAARNVQVVMFDQAVLAPGGVPRAESKQVVQALGKMGMEVVLLTGDSDAAAQGVAQGLGIDRYFAQVSPEQKSEKVTELETAGKHVAMVSPGRDDAPALAAASVGIVAPALGGGARDQTESASIVLTGENPLAVVRVIELSRASERTINQNLAWAAGYHLVALPLAAGLLAPMGILLSPVIGAALMALCAILVALNTQRLRRAQRVT
ncbi:MAG: HAD-IC family P-type ATPase [Anaerolineae bacterium]